MAYPNIDSSSMTLSSANADFSRLPLADNDLQMTGASSGIDWSSLGLDGGEINALLQEELLYGLDSDPNQRPAVSFGGPQIDAIVRNHDANGKPKPALKRSDAVGDTLKKLELAAKGGAATYEPMKEEFKTMLAELSKRPLSEIKYSECARLISASGASNLTSSFVGSVADSFISAIPKELVKAPFRLGFGSTTRSAVADVVAHSGLSIPSSKSAVRSAVQPVRAAVQVISGEALKPLNNIGINGRLRVPPRQDALITSAQLHQCRQEILDTVIKMRTDRGLGGETNGTADSSAPLDEDWQRFKEDLVAKLSELTAKENGLRAVTSLDSRQAAAVAVALATVTVQIVARIGAGVALSSVSLAVLAPLVAVVVYPTMTAAGKLVSNCQDVKEIARSALDKYNEKFGDLSKSKDEPTKDELTGLSRYIQDCVQTADQANYHRRIENVFVPKLGQAEVLIVKADHKLGDLRELRASRNKPELKATRKRIETRQKISAINLKFKPKHHLLQDSLAVETLVKHASDTGKYSDKVFQELIGRNAGALLTVQTASDGKSVALFDSFKQAYASRFGKPVQQAELMQRYKAVIYAMRIWLGFALHPADADPIPAYATLSFPGEGKLAEQNQDRYVYLKRNLDLLNRRSEKETRLARYAPVDLPDEVKDVEKASQKFDRKIQKIDDEIFLREDKLSIDIEKLKAYLVDFEHYQNGEGALINADGKVAAQILSNDRGVLRGFKYFARHNFRAALKEKFLRRVAYPTVYTLGVEGSNVLVRSGLLSTRPAIGTALIDRAQAMPLAMEQVEEWDEMSDSEGGRPKRSATALAFYRYFERSIAQKESEIKRISPSPAEWARLEGMLVTYRGLDAEVKKIGEPGRFTSDANRKKYESATAQMKSIKDERWDWLNVKLQLERLGREIGKLNIRLDEQRGNLSGRELFEHALEKPPLTDPVVIGAKFSGLVSELKLGMASSSPDENFAAYKALAGSLKRLHVDQASGVLELAALIPGLGESMRLDAALLLLSTSLPLDAVRDQVTLHLINHPGYLWGREHEELYFSLVDAVKKIPPHEASEETMALILRLDTLEADKRGEAFDHMLSLIVTLGDTEKFASLNVLIAQIFKFAPDDRYESFVRALMLVSSFHDDEKAAPMDALMKEICSFPADKLLDAFELCRTTVPGTDLTSAFNLVIARAKLLEDGARDSYVESAGALIPLLPEAARKPAAASLRSEAETCDPQVYARTLNALADYPDDDAQIDPPVDPGVDPVAGATAFDLKRRMRRATPRAGSINEVPTERAR